jgi:very-short-patch-repair endonuclease
MEDIKNILVVPVRIPPEITAFIFIGLFIVVAGPILLRFRHLIFNSARRKSSGLFELAPYLLTKGENAFLPALEQAVGGRFRVAMKVRLGDLVCVRGNDSRAVSARNSTNQKHVDFVLCSHYPVKPLLVIELDDVLHDRPKGQRRDRLVDECLDSAGLPILHVRCRQAYGAVKLTADIQALVRTGI